MTDDPDIIEAAAQRLAKLLGSPDHKYLRGFVRAILDEATPLIRAAALEEAARVAEDSVMTMVNKIKVAAAIRALKEQP